MITTCGMVRSRRPTLGFDKAFSHSATNSCARFAMRTHPTVLRNLLVAPVAPPQNITHPGPSATKQIIMEFAERRLCAHGGAFAQSTAGSRWISKVAKRPRRRHSVFRGADIQVGRPRTERNGLPLCQARASLTMDSGSAFTAVRVEVISKARTSCQRVMAHFTHVTNCAFVAARAEFGVRAHLTQVIESSRWSGSIPRVVLPTFALLPV